MHGDGPQTSQNYAQELDSFFRNNFMSIAQDMFNLNNHLQAIPWDTNNPKEVTEYFATSHLAEQLFQMNMEITNKINNLYLNIANAPLDENITAKVNRGIAGIEQALNILKQSLPPEKHAFYYQYERQHRVLDALMSQTNNMKQVLNGDNSAKQSAKNAIDNAQVKIAFLSGQNKKIDKAFASDNERHIALEHGPIPKNYYTVQFEEMIKAMLNNQPYELRRMDKDKNQHFDEVIINNKSYNLNEILKNTNYSHLSFSEADQNAYMEMLIDKAANSRTPSQALPMFDYDSNKLPKDLTGAAQKRKMYELMDESFKASIDRSNASKPDDQKDDFLKHISIAERMALNIYSSNFYVSENDLLRGNIESALLTKEAIKNILNDSSGLDEKQIERLEQRLKKREFIEKQDDIKDILCACAMAKTALSKKISPNQPNESNDLNEYKEPNKKQMTYRGEDNLNKDFKGKRDAAIQNQTPVDTKGFISTAADKPVLNFAFNNESSSKIGVVIEAYGVDISPISQVSSEREVLASGGQVFYEGKREIGENETIYKAKKVETLTGLRPEQLQTTADRMQEQKMNELSDKLEKLYAKKENLNQKAEKSKKKLSPLKWAANQLKTNQINLQINLIDRKINHLETKLQNMQVNMDDRTLQGRQAYTEQKMQELKKNTDDMKLFDLIEEYNQKIAKNPMLDQNQFTTYIDVVKKLQVTSNADVDNQKKIKEFIEQIYSDKGFASLLAQLKQKDSISDIEKRQMEFLEISVSFANRDRIAKLLSPKIDDNVKNQFLSSLATNHPSEALSHANKFAQTKDYDKLLQLVQLALAHHQNEAHDNSIWKFKDNELSAMCALLKNVIENAKSENSEHFSRLLSATHTFQNTFADQIDHKQEHTSLHQNQHPEALHMFHHAVQEHHASINKLEQTEQGPKQEAHRKAKM